MINNRTGPLLDIRGLHAGYDRRPVVHDLSLAVPSGHVLGIVGESGSGKTTLARAIAGEIPPLAGSLALDGTPLDGVRRTVAQRRAIQVVYQDPYASLNPRMTVGQVLTELLTVHALVPRSRVRERCLDLLGLVRLPAAVLDSHPRTLSGGQRQRVAIARALAVEPRLLVADEPTSALDVSVQLTVLDLLAELRRDLGLTIVLISHDLGVVRHLCDTVVVMRSGRVVESASAADFFTGPGDPYSRELLAAAPRLNRPTR